MDWLYFIATYAVVMVVGWITLATIIALGARARDRLRRPRLNPCKGCGGKAVPTRPEGWHSVECRACGTASGHWSDREYAAHIWNRVNPPAKSRGA